MLGTVVSRNFRGLARAARDIGEGKIVPTSASGSTAELRSLAAQLEETSARLAESYARERRSRHRVEN